MAKKGERIRVGGKTVISDGKGGGRVVNAADRQRDSARARIKRDTASGKAPPIPQVISGPRTQKALNKARKKKKTSNALNNEPTNRGLRKAFDNAADTKKKAARKRKS